MFWEFLFFHFILHLQAFQKNISEEIYEAAEACGYCLKEGTIRETFGSSFCWEGTTLATVTVTVRLEGLDVSLAV